MSEHWTADALLAAGYTPESVAAALMADDRGLLVHSGLVRSVEKPAGIRGSALTGIAATAAAILAGRADFVPGGLVIPGRPVVYYLAVCRECGDLVVPFDLPAARRSWAAGHPHDIAMGIEIRGVIGGFTR
jgi:hypothetical protein